MGWFQDDRAYALWAISRPLLLAGAIAGFILWWPIGFALLLLAIWNKRLGRVMFGVEACGPQRFGCGWGGQSGAPWGRRSGSGGNGGRSSGNKAFDEYRAATLRRLEEEQAEFTSFLDRLRFAKDKAEFDQFMAERRARPAPGDEREPPAQG
jgi:hypothetical protein